MKPWLRWTLGILLGLALLVAGLWWEENRRGRLIWEETCARLRAAGEPVELADIIPPHIPDQENVAAAPIFAEVFEARDSREPRLLNLPSGWIYTPRGGSERVHAPEMRPVAREDDSLLAEWESFLTGYNNGAPTVKVTKPSPDRVLSSLEPTDHVWNEISVAVRRPKWRPPLNYDGAWNVEMPHLKIVTGIRTIAQPRLVAFAVQGDAQGYTDTLITCLKAARTYVDPPVDLISLTLGMGSEALVLRDWQNTLACVDLGEEQLAALQRQAQWISVQDIAASLRCERVRSNRMFRDFTLEVELKLMEQARSFHGVAEGNTLLDRAKAVLTYCRPPGLKLADAAFHHDFHVGHVLSCISVDDGVITPAAVARLEREIADLPAHSGWTSAGRWMAMMLESNPVLLRKGAKLQARANGAVAWCAIERFRLKNGRLPDRLEELTPDFLEKVPVDPVNGLPLRYVRKGNGGYLIYSVGWNEKDENGAVVKKGDEGDWVWASDPTLIVNLDEERREAEEREAKEREAKAKEERAKRKTKRKE